MSDAAFTPILLALPSLTPTLAVEIIPYGLTIHRLFVQTDGRTHDIVVGPEDPKGHIEQKYANTIVGRYANRLPVGPHEVSRNGITATFVGQPNESADVSLHGGPVGFDSKVWTPLVDPSAAQLFTAAELGTIQTNVPAFVILSLVSEDGDEGFPGRLLTEVLVGLIQPEGPPVKRENLPDQWNLGSLVIVYRAKLLDEGKVTPINLTQHWGFNLDASLKEGPETLSIMQHKVNIKADNTVALAANGLSIGSLLPVKGTPHAHADKPNKQIRENFPAGGYDQFYLFNPRATPAVPTRIPASELTPEFDGLKAIVDPAAKIDPVVEFESDRSGLKIDFDTNKSGVQFYTNNLANPLKGARKRIHGGSGVAGAGDGYDVGSAVFLEFHEPLAAWMYPSTRGPSGDDTLLTSGEIYNNYVRLNAWFSSPEGL